MCAARGVDRECCVMVAKTGCVIDGNVCMSQRKKMKTVTAPEKKHVFHHENIAYLMKVKATIVLLKIKHLICLSKL